MIVKNNSPYGGGRLDDQQYKREMETLERMLEEIDKQIQIMVDHMAIHAAEEALVDRRMFRLDDAMWQAFQDVLDRPIQSKPRLAKLLAEKSVLE